jgi:hypothetical protein
MISVSTIPARVKYSPLRKTLVEGRNIQKAETTKNNNDNPKKIFK